MQFISSPHGRTKKVVLKTRFAVAIACSFISIAITDAAMVNPNPASPLKTKKVLVVTGGTAGDHAPARDATLTNLQAMAAKVPFSLTIGNPLTLTDASLAPYDIIVFNYFFETQSSAAFPDAAKTAFQNWLKKPGKGWIGYHTSGANEYAKSEWIWYQDNVTGMRYALHGSGTPQGTITKTTDAATLANPIMEGLPSTFTSEDEWYNYETSSKLYTDGSKVMFYLSNAGSMTPPRFPSPIHPVAWYRQDENGTRYFYTPFGHTIAGANSDWMKSVILRALEYVSGDPTTIALTPETRSNLLAGTPDYLSASQALPIDIPGEYRISVWSTNGRMLASAEGEGSRSYSLAPLKNAGTYIVTVDSKAAKLSHRLQVY
jgi:type 1 glutamine amidotransferase